MALLLMSAGRRRHIDSASELTPKLSPAPMSLFWSFMRFTTDLQQLMPPETMGGQSQQDSVAASLAELMAHPTVASYLCYDSPMPLPLQNSPPDTQRIAVTLKSLLALMRSHSDSFCTLPSAGSLVQLFAPLPCAPSCRRSAQQAGDCQAGVWGALMYSALAAVRRAVRRRPCR